MSRKRRPKGVNPLDQPPSESSFSLDDFAAAGYGDTGGLFVDERVIAEPISIFEIRPDPLQPRRAIPSTVREKWDGKPETMPQLLKTWHQMVETELRRPVDIKTYIEGGMTLDKDGNEVVFVPAPSMPISVSFIKMLQVASSIFRDGLINPITIAREGSFYVIETGERRWAAYHLLNAVYGDSDANQWGSIPARDVGEADVWRQASENNARDDLNAIGRARQYALLMMDLWANDRKNPQHFAPLSNFSHEQAFYAQAADLSAPYGSSKRLMDALGAGSPATFTRCRKLLNLPRELWVIGDDLALPEDTLVMLADMPIEKALAHIPKLFESKRFEQKKSPARKVLPSLKVMEKDQKAFDNVLRMALKAKGKSREQWREYAQQRIHHWQQLLEQLDG